MSSGKAKRLFKPGGKSCETGRISPAFSTPGEAVPETPIQMVPDLDIKFPIKNPARLVLWRSDGEIDGGNFHVVPRAA